MYYNSQFLQPRSRCCSYMTDMDIFVRSLRLPVASDFLVDKLLCAGGNDVWVMNIKDLEPLV